MTSKRKIQVDSGEEKREQAQEAEGAEPEAISSETETPEPEGAEQPSLSPEEVARLIREKEEQYDRLLRTQADFDNYRKRVQREQANLIRYGSENALREILPVVDNIERAVQSARAHDDSDSQLREGVEMILNQLFEAFEKLGLRPVETVGHAFDPNKHDALIHVHAPDAPEGSVIQEIRKGYYLHDKVLRPAQVTVGTHEPPHQAGEASEENN
jgi:molecular chaperone GrpE